MEKRFIAVVRAYESGAIPYEEACARILELTGREIDRYTLDQYDCGEGLEDLARRWCMPPIADWRGITDEEALRLLREILADVCNVAIRERNSEALEKRYGKPEGTVTSFIFHSSLSDPDEMLRRLKKDTRFYL